MLLGLSNKEKNKLAKESLANINIISSAKEGNMEQTFVEIASLLNREVVSLSTREKWRIFRNIRDFLKKPKGLFERNKNYYVNINGVWFELGEIESVDIIDVIDEQPLLVTYDHDGFINNIIDITAFGIKQTDEAIVYEGRDFVNILNKEVKKKQKVAEDKMKYEDKKVAAYKINDGVKTFIPEEYK